MTMRKKVFFSVAALCIVVLIGSWVFGKSDAELAAEKKAAAVDPRPADQLVFLKTIHQFQKDYAAASGNEIVKEEIRTKALAYLNEKRSMDNWLGSVKEINAHYDKPFVVVTMFPYNAMPPELQNQNYGNKITVEVDNVPEDQARTLKPGDVFRFSGTIYNEKSITDEGAIEEPEFVAELRGTETDHEQNIAGYSSVGKALDDAINNPEKFAKQADAQVQDWQRRVDSIEWQRRVDSMKNASGSDDSVTVIQDVFDPEHPTIIKTSDGREIETEVTSEDKP